MTSPNDNPSTPISAEVAGLRQYLTDRAIPIDPTYLDAAGLELAGGQRISEVLGAPYPHKSGIIIHYPGTDYATVRLVPGGPRCPKGRTPHAYLCPTTDWPRVAGTIVICESPLKALTWSHAGYNALAAGGVTTVYMPRRSEWCEGFPHAAIESGAVDTVVIAWDSDIEDNHNVAAAQRELARALQDRHPRVAVKIHKLPPPPDDDARDHWGCDDARAHWGAEWFAAWAAEPAFRTDPKRDELRDHLDQLNERYTVVLSECKVVNLATGTFCTADQFKGVVEIARTVPGENKPIKVAPIWLARKDRPTVQGVIYAPGEEQITGENYNVWKPSPLVPRKGDVSLWLDLLNDAVKDDETRELMLDCMAYQVQNRGKRLEKLLYFVGRQVGTGKSTQAAIMRDILGASNTGWVTRTELESGYNAAWAAKELVVLDDVAKLKKDSWGMIKTHITSDDAVITEKYMTARQQPNYCTFYITSNQADILTTDTEDRRVLMIPFEPTVVHRDKDDPYWPAFHKWLRGEGVAAIAHYLMTRDLSDFNPHFYPPTSSIKEAAIEGTREDDELFLKDFRENPEHYVPDGRIAITSSELYMIYSGEAPSTFNQNSRHRMTQLASVVEQYPRAIKGQFMTGGKRSTCYWIPGRVPESTITKSQERAKRVIRANIKKYPLTLSES